MSHVSPDPVDLLARTGDDPPYFSQPPLRPSPVASAVPVTPDNTYAPGDAGSTPFAPRVGSPIGSPSLLHDRVDQIEEMLARLTTRPAAVRPQPSFAPIPPFIAPSISPPIPVSPFAPLATNLPLQPRLAQPPKPKRLHFNGKVDELPRFLTDYEIAFPELDYTDALRITSLIRYVDNGADSDLISMLDTYTNPRSWIDFRRDVIDAFGALEEEQFTPANLTSYVKRLRDQDCAPRTLIELNAYHRTFTRMAGFLKKSNRITVEIERDRFVEGLHSSIASQLANVGKVLIQADRALPVEQRQYRNEREIFATVPLVMHHARQLFRDDDHFTDIFQPHRLLSPLDKPNAAAVAAKKYALDDTRTPNRIESESSEDEGEDVKVSRRTQHKLKQDLRKSRDRNRRMDDRDELTRLKQRLEIAERQVANVQQISNHANVARGGMQQSSYRPQYPQQALQFTQPASSFIPRLASRPSHSYGSPSPIPQIENRRSNIQAPIASTSAQLYSSSSQVQFRDAPPHRQIGTGNINTSSLNCYYCGGAHYARDCGEMSRDASSGLIQLDGQVVIHNGVRTYSSGTQTVKDKIRELERNNKKKMISSNLLQIHFASDVPPTSLPEPILPISLDSRLDSFATSTLIDASLPSTFSVSHVGTTTSPIIASKDFSNAEPVPFVAPLFTIDATFSSQTRAALVDTGSMINLMSKDFFDSLDLALSPTTLSVQSSVKGQVARAAGVVENVSFKVDGVTFTSHFFVVDATNWDVLLGSGFLFSSRARFEYRLDRSASLTLWQEGREFLVSSLRMYGPDFLHSISTLGCDSTNSGKAQQA